MIRYLWYMNPAGAIQKEIYFIYSNNQLSQIKKDLVPVYSPFEYHKNAKEDYRKFEEGVYYSIQNGYVLDLKLINHDKTQIIVYCDFDRIFLKFNNQTTIIIDKKTKINCFRFINYCHVKIMSDRGHTFKFFFPFAYFFLYDAVQDTDECSPFFYLMKEWESLENREHWIKSWISGIYIDRWISLLRNWR